MIRDEKYVDHDIWDIPGLGGGGGGGGSDSSICIFCSADAASHLTEENEKCRNENENSSTLMDFSSLV